MAKFSSFDEFKQGTFSHDLMGDGKMVATMNVAEAIPGFDSMADWVKAALHFAIKTGSRNATAGLLKEDPAKAYERVQERFKSWAGGVWRAASEASGEPRTSLLARAVAEVMGIDVSDAAEQITALIDNAVDEKGLDRDEEGDKAKIRKIGADIRANLKKDVGVAKVFARLQAEEAAKRAEAVAGQEGESQIATLLKR